MHVCIFFTLPPGRGRGVAEMGHGYLEEALKNARQGKEGPKLLISDVVLGLPEALSPEGHIPLAQLLCEALALCKLAHLLELLLGWLEGCGPQLLQQSIRFLQACHL